MTTIMAVLFRFLVVLSCIAEVSSTLPWFGFLCKIFGSFPPQTVLCRILRCCIVQEDPTQSPMREPPPQTDQPSASAGASTSFPSLSPTVTPSVTASVECSNCTDQPSVGATTAFPSLSPTVTPNATVECPNCTDQPSTGATTAFPSLSPTVAPNATASVVCPNCTTLEELVANILTKTPVRDSEAYEAPSETVMNDWEHVVETQMLDPSAFCRGSLPDSLVNFYDLGLFVDEENSKTYCVLASSVVNLDNKAVKPWGTVIVNSMHDFEANNVKALSIDITHPLNDLYTASQGIAIFKGTDAKTFVLSGSHRYANSVVSSCDGGYEEADAAHTLNTFQSSIIAIDRYFTNTLDRHHVALQFHGMGSGTCPFVDVFLTHGRDIAPQEGEGIDALRDALYTAGATGNYTVPGEENECSLTGGNNVQGRYLNNVDPNLVCVRSSDGYTGKFIHIEQNKSPFRDDRNFDQYWIGALNSVDFDAATPPTGFRVTYPNAGGETFMVGDTVNITWTWTGAAGSAISGNVKLSLATNDDTRTFNQTIETSIANTGSYLWTIDNGVAAGTNYLDRVRSVSNTNIRDFSDESFTITA